MNTKLRLVLLGMVLALGVISITASTRSGWTGGPGDQGYIQFYDTGGSKLITFASDRVFITNAVLSGSLTSLGAAQLTAGSSATAINGLAITNISAASLKAGTAASAIDGGAITNVTGTASANGTVLNALDISACTNLPASGIISGNIEVGRLTNALEGTTTGDIVLGTNVFLSTSGFSQATTGATTNLITGLGMTATVVRVGNIILTWTQAGP